MLLPGQVLNNRYQIVNQLGQGGFGAVYRAWDTSLRRACAVKENLDISPESQKQFALEASILANLHHPSLPRVTDHFTIAGQGQYLVMDFVEGENLENWVGHQGPATCEQAQEWISQVIDALNYLHSQQPPIIHRDIKPANILITPEGRAFLVDFGIVKQYTPGRKTTRAAQACTSGYSPPEQYGRGVTDARSDIYALGATLYNLLTGIEPPDSVQRTIQDTLIPANRASAKVKPKVAVVIARAMELTPALRFQSVLDMGHALKRACGAGLIVGQGWLKVATAVLAVVLCGLVVAGVAMAVPFMIASTPTPTDQLPPGFTETPTSRPPGRTIAPSPTERREPREESTPTPQSSKDMQRILTLSPEDGVIVMASARSGHTEIWLMNADGTGLRQLTNHQHYSDEPEFSPDGQWIAFERKYGDQDDYEIHIISRDSGGEYSLGQGREPAWSPDGQWIAFEDGDGRGHIQVWRMTSDGGNREQLTFDDHDNRAPDWSPDGKYLAMMSKVGNNWQIVILDVASQRQTPITKGSPDKRFPAWSPDGQWIAYNTLKGGAPDQIWVIDVNGENASKLTSGGQNGRPCWSQDSRYLLYNSTKGGAGQIMRVALEGGESQVVSPPVGSSNGDQQPDWSQP